MLKINTSLIGKYFAYVISAPFIYFVFFWFLFLHICVEIYHRICFPIYGIEYVKLKNYIIIDRHKLSYLNFFQKFNCVYCGYANGLLAYITEISARTEKFWCPIQHKHTPWQFYPLHHHDFVPYANADAWKKRQEEINTTHAPFFGGKQNLKNKKKNTFK